jgi:hypothetical protein
MAMKGPVGSPRATALAIGLAVFWIYALTGGGRIVGSDEIAMFDLSRAMLHGHIDVPESSTLKGVGGRFYTKNAAGQAVIALPIVALAEGAARASGLPAAGRELAARFVVSFFNAAVAALLIGLFYLGARRLGIGARPALGAAAMLAFTTPLWVYSKSFMAEPLEALGLLLVCVDAARARANETRDARYAGIGACLAISVKLSMLAPALVLCATILGSRPRLWVWPAIGIAIALAGHAFYDLKRSGAVLATGYGAQATPAAYTTPLLVGLYGLLLSSGKGVMWFAPVLWLVPRGWSAMSRGGAHRADAPLRRRAAWYAGWGILLACVACLALYAKFQHWAGDGSWGPRYLVPLLPLAFLAVAFALHGASRNRRRLAWALALAGLIVQIGGVSIYFGAQMREAGDYPYRVPLEDPRSMSDSHFNPAFSPIAAHWGMLARNAGEHLRGAAPRLSGGGEVDPRLGVSAADQRQLLHALDFWWAYMGYAGIARGAILGAIGVLLALAGAALIVLRRALAAEARAG